MDLHITYETLFDLLRKERSLNELQNLDKEFWQHVVQYLSMLDENLKKNETEKLKLQITNVKKIIQEIYDKREKKLINLALNVVKTDASSFIDTQTMLDEEKIIFNEFVISLKAYKKAILSNVFAGHLPDIAQVQHIKNNLNSTLNIEIKHPQVKKEIQPIEPVEQEPVETDYEQKETEEFMDMDEDVDEERKKVKFLSAVPKFLGKNKDVFGPFKEGDEAELPSKIVSILVKKGKVESS